jgi:flagellar protein FlaG
MPIRSVEVSTGITSIRAATASATTSKQSQRPPANPTETSKAATPAAVPAQAAPPPPKPTQSESQMRFHVDQDTGKTVVALVDPENGEVIRQFPTAEALEVAKEIGRFQGMFVNLKV